MTGAKEWTKQQKSPCCVAPVRRWTTRGPLYECKVCEKRCFRAHLLINKHEVQQRRLELIKHKSRARTLKALGYNNNKGEGD